MRTYILEYSALKENGDSIKYWGKIKIRNCDNELHAKNRLEKHLKEKFPNMYRLIIHSCRDDFEISSDAFDFLKNIVNGKG